MVMGVLRIVTYVEDIPFTKIERRAGSKEHNKPTYMQALTQLFLIQEISYLRKLLTNM